MATTIPHKILANGERLGAAPAYHAKRDGIWHQTSWQQYAHEVRQAGAGFLALGVEPSTPVAMLGFNRPEWVIFDVGAMAVGAVPAGIYTTSSPDEVAYVLNHSEAPVVLVENESQWEKVRVRRDQLPHLRQVVMMSGAGPIDDPMVMSWEAFMSAGDQVAPARVQERLDRLSPDDLGTLIYTSGTTGPPKAVMLSHHNLAWTSGQANDMIGVGPTDRVLSYLPLSHIAEQSFTISGPAHNGYQVFYAESIERLPQNLLEVRPTIFFAVPRVWEKFQAGIKAKLGEARGIKAKLAGRAMAVGRQVAALRNQGRTVPALLDAQYQLFDRLVYGKVKEAIGLGEAKFMVSGAAPVAPEVLEFLAGLGMTVYEVYGQSEDTGPTSFNVPG